MGRPLGSRNKRSQEFYDRIARNFPNVCPVEKMLELGMFELDLIKNGEVVSMSELKEAIEIAEQDGDTRKYDDLLRKITFSKKLALDCFKEAAPYLQAKLRSVEIESNDPGSMAKAAIVVHPIKEGEWEEAALEHDKKVREIAKQYVGEDEAKEDETNKKTRKELNNE